MDVTTHFGLRQRPFRHSPDTGAYYPASGHEAALATLADALAADAGFAALAAGPGLGKSLVAQLLIDRHAAANTLLLTNARVRTAAELFQALLFDLGLPYEAKTEQELRLALTGKLLEAYAAGQPTLIVVDEAHHLTPHLLEELRLLGNLETRRGKAVQVVLIGLPALFDTLAAPELAALSQRLTARATLAPLDVVESTDYLLHQLKAAGARPNAIVTDDALDLLARAGGGTPRVLNQLGDALLTVTGQAGVGRADTEAALEAIQRVMPGATFVDDEPSSVPMPATVIAEPVPGEVDHEWVMRRAMVPGR